MEFSTPDSSWESLTKGTVNKKELALLTKVCVAKAMVFPVVMYKCESWTIKKAEELMLLNCGVGEDS